MKPLRKNSGMTLVEILVVLGITALLLTVTATTLSSSMAGNQRNTCVVNLYNIHQAMTMYMHDFTNPPPFDPTTPTIANPCTISASWQGSPRIVTRPGNMGLLLLYSYGLTRNDPNTDYLRGMKSLRCPMDFDLLAGQRDPTTPQCPRDLNNPAVESIFNVDAMSYQTIDPLAVDASTNQPQWTYTPYRLYDDSNNNINTIARVRAYQYNNNNPVLPDYRRQLAVPAYCYDGGGTCPPGLAYNAALNQRLLQLSPKWHPSDDTVITWCIFHRNTMRPYDHDNVLFMDGSVEFLPAVQMPIGNCLNTRAGAARLPDLARRRECGLP